MIAMGASSLCRSGLNGCTGTEEKAARLEGCGTRRFGNKAHDASRIVCQIGLQNARVVSSKDSTITASCDFAVSTTP
ncbi:hypothetical protein FOZ60_008710 [Perkinsus olseni]|uniref:Uncharacterized protein n=1 Tax=Perkinsus olseni TaxID=32597 RepID=A0A7J6PDH3_PEROL|nr:hypothetical protein FOZ60_008710 [Perkinsus olseni]